MNASNPFRVPACLARASLADRRRLRLRRIVVIGVVTSAAFLVVLLIGGCMAQHSRVPIAVKPTAPAAPVSAPRTTALAMSMPVPAPRPLAPSAKSLEREYTVKSGDTLARIAAQHHTTAQAIRAINRLKNDHLTVGAKLKLPA